MMDYSKYNIDDLENYKRCGEERISALEIALKDMHRIEKEVQDVLTRIGDHLLMDSDFGRLFTVLTSDLGDNVYRLKLIKDEISKRNVSFRESGSFVLDKIIKDQSISINYDSNGNRILHFPAIHLGPTGGISSLVDPESKD